MEMRNVKAGVQVLRNLSSNERRELAMGPKHRTRGNFWNRPIWKGVIVRCRIGDNASDPIKRVRIGGSSQGIVPGSLLLCARNSNLVIHGAIVAVVFSLLLSHNLTSSGASTMWWRNRFWEVRVQARPTNEQDFKSRLDERLSMISSIIS